MGLLSFLGLKRGTSVPEVEKTDIDEADILYAGTQRTDTREGVTEELVDRGLEVAELSPSDLEDVEASDLEGKTVFYRDKMFASCLEVDEKFKAKFQLQELKKQGVNTVNSVSGSVKSNDKDVCKDEMSEALRELSFAGTPDTYDSIEEVEERLEPRDRLVEKPVDGSMGRDIQFRQAGKIEELREGFTYEEFVPHETNDEDMWEEAVDSRIWVLGDEIEVVDRAVDEEGPSATNLAQGGFYKEETMEYGSEEELVAQRISKQLDMDVFAIDCVRRKTEQGYKEIIPYEANSTAQIEYITDSPACDTDICEGIADVIEQSHESDRIEGSVTAGDYQAGGLDFLL